MVEKYEDGMSGGVAGNVSIVSLQHSIRELAFNYGACCFGVNTLQSLAGGPPSTDLTMIQESACAAITIAVAQDQDHIRNYLSKKDRHGHQRDQNRTNTMATGIAAQITSYLQQFGAEATTVVANAEYRRDDGIRYLDHLPVISHRYLAVACGLGWFGFSGNVLTPEHGPSVVFATVICDLPLEATEPLAEADNYCDDCQACNASCPSGFFRYGKKNKVTITMGGRDYTYTERRDYARCTYVCAGYNGLHPNGRWSTWAPGRFPIPKEDKELRAAYREAIPPFEARPTSPGVINKQPITFGLGGRDLSTSCGNCSLVCHPDRKERDDRVATLHQSGVVVQHDDGDLEAMPAKEARAYLDAMPVERRRIYEAEDETG